jgi:hypothetical protein
MTHHNQTGLDDHQRTIVHHSFDPLALGTGEEMDYQVMVISVPWPMVERIVA